MKLKYLIIALIGLFLLGAIVYQNYQKNNLLDTKNWRTYTFTPRDKDYGFSIKYPKEWKAVNTTGGILFEHETACSSRGKQCPQVFVGIYGNGNDSLNPSDLCPSEVINKKTTRLDGENAVLFECLNISSDIGKKIIIANHKGKRFEISFDESITYEGSGAVKRSQWKSENIFDEMLLTFKFIP